MPSVVLITRDRADRLPPTLGRLLALPEVAEVVVVDNGSADDTAAIARRAGARVIELGRNAGAAARNVGVREARSPVVAFADDDSWWAPGALATAQRCFEDHPALGLLAARILVGEEERLDPTCAVMAESPLPARPELPGRPVLGFVACGSVVRRDAFLQAGGFWPPLGVGGEEGLLAMDLEHAGWGCAYVDAVVAHHHPDPRPRAGRDATALRNDLWTTWLRRPVPVAAVRSAALLRAVPPKIAVTAGARAVRGAHLVARDRRPVGPELEGRLRLLEGTA